MKKYLVILLLLVVLLHGCAEKSVTPTTTEDPREIPSISWAEHVKLNIDRLNRLLERIDVPEDFVRYEQIEKYGSFLEMSFTSNVMTDGYNKYIYYLKEPNQYSFAFEFNHGDQTETKPMVGSSEFVNGLTRMKTDDSGWVLHCGAYYYYEEGALREILWRINEVECKLILNNRVDYPKSWWRSSFLQTLLYGTNRQIEKALADFAVRVFPVAN